MNLNGGYIIINKSDANIYAKANEALIKGKPILWYEDNTTCYFIDTIALSDDDVVLTKGGKTITVTDTNVVTESGTIQPSGGGSSTHRLKISAYSDDPSTYVVELIVNVTDTDIDTLAKLQTYLIDNHFTSSFDEDVNHYVINGLSAVGYYEYDTSNFCPSGITAFYEDDAYAISVLFNTPEGAAAVDGQWLYNTYTYTFEYLD